VFEHLLEEACRDEIDPGRLERIGRARPVVDQQDLFRDVETLARRSGQSATIEAWGTDLPLLRGRVLTPLRGQILHSNTSPESGAKRSDEFVPIHPAAVDESAPKRHANVAVQDLTPG
jgi:hypothetical protein